MGTQLRRGVDNSLNLTHCIEDGCQGPAQGSAALDHQQRTSGHVSNSSVNDVILQPAGAHSKGQIEPQHPGSIAGGSQRLQGQTAPVGEQQHCVIPLPGPRLDLGPVGCRSHLLTASGLTLHHGVPPLHQGSRSLGAQWHKAAAEARCGCIRACHPCTRAVESSTPSAPQLNAATQATCGCLMACHSCTRAWRHVCCNMSATGRTKRLPACKPLKCQHLSAGSCQWHMHRHTALPCMLPSSSIKCCASMLPSSAVQ